jgi:hypothetical protein
VGVDGEYGGVVMYCYDFDINTAFNWVGTNFSSLVELIATLVATFIGAYLAFKYQNRFDRKKEEDAQIASGNRVIFQMSGNVSWLQNTKTQLIDPIREDPSRMFKMLPDLSSTPEAGIDVQSIDFLLKTKDADILGELLIEKRRFEQAVSLQERHSKFVLEQIYPMIGQAGVKQGQSVTEAEMRTILGDLKWGMLESITNHYIEAVDKTLESHLKLAPLIRKALLSAVPNGKFIQFSLR